MQEGKKKGEAVKRKKEKNTLGRFSGPEGKKKGREENLFPLCRRKSREPCRGKEPHHLLSCSGV